MAGAEDIADRAWVRLGHRSENQAVVFLYGFLPVSDGFPKLTKQIGASLAQESQLFDPIS